jgi:hypothetical protein
MAKSIDHRAARPQRRRAFWPSLMAFVLLSGVLLAQPLPAEAACSGNAIACENQLPGTPRSEWDVVGVGDSTIQGFATQISVNAGSRIDFKIKTDARAYQIKIYRLGYYQGLGAREVATINPSASLPQNQPACVTDSTTDIYDCGTWAVSASWQVPATAVSGVYVARPIRSDTTGDSHIVFIVRNDGNTSNVLFQTSDSTWQAYNLYGGASFYSGGTNRTQAVKLSYNRPFATRGGVEAHDWLFSNEYPMIRFLEQNGYDVSYVSGLDVHSDPSLLPKHKVFLSVGHDEYWSKQQRANVTAARDAGVNLAFFSGNEVYWKTRWEPSQDGTSTPNRTLVTYKDTWAGVRTDPVEATATWRDPRFGDLGFGPENGLTGTMYMSNNTDLALTVSSAEGKYRLWRNTTLTSLADGQTAALADHTVGYESNEDIDNGSRPAGLVRLSTTTGPTPEYLQDFGLVVKPGTTTHHVTLYRAASGALVFSAGTIQWCWGLDSVHDGVQQAADPRIRQATANVLADMKALPTTVASDLTMPATTTDATGPTATITQPAANADITQGSLVTVKGTASDVGGRVAGVEVSVDGGLSFHPANGTTSWSYTGILTGNGTSAIQVRAADDSANLGAVQNLTVNSPCPCSIFGSATPDVPDAGDTDDVTLGVRFSTTKAGVIQGVRFYKASTNTGEHTGTLYTASGDVLATGTFTGETASGWQTLWFATAVPIEPGVTYVAAYHAPRGHYSADGYDLLARHVSGPLQTVAEDNGVWANGNAFPSSTYQSTNYWVDVVYSDTETRPATVSAQSPLPGANSVLTNAVVKATFSRTVTASSVVASLVDSGGVAIPGAVAYNPDSRVVTFTPTQVLAQGITYTATVSADGLAAPASWTFTTVTPAPPAGTCPCSVFTDSDQPAAGPDTDTDSVTLGMAFHPTVDGVINGIRFFKNVDNYGTRKVALWDASGTLLAEAEPSSESPLGWQEVAFATPVSVTKGTVYTASYVAPRGRYAYTNSGLSSAVTRGPLTTEVTGGRYTYSNGAPASRSTANYFVDVVFNRASGGAPAVTTISPAADATSVPVTAAVAVTFNTDVTPGVTTIKLTRHSDGAVIAGAVGNESQGSLVTFQPAQDLEPGVRYDVEVSGAQSLAGVPMAAPFRSSFTTSGAAVCPCSLLSSTATPALADSGDPDAVTLGLRFTSSVSGRVTGLRYYRAAANTGSHKGTLWSVDGTKLAELTFTDGAAGWTSASFATPVSITAGTTYVASYYAPKGHYSADLDFFAQPYVNTPLSSVGAGSYYTYSDGFPNSTYRNSNYYVDVLFDTNSDTAPTVLATAPMADQTGVAQDTAVTATFSSAITASSLNFAVATASDGVVIPGTVTYDSATRVAKFTPGAQLAPSTRYRATVTANSSAGVAIAQPKVWDFTTTAVLPAEVTATTPLDADVDVDPAAAITATFSASTQASSVSLTLTQGTTTVAGSMSYDATTRVARFTPSSALAGLTSYTATATASNTSGVAMAAPKTWTFTTTDAQPVTFASFSPASGATNVANTAKVTAVASKAIDQSSLTVQVTGPGSTAVAGATAYDPATRTVTFTPSANLASATSYTVRVSARTAAGVAMPSPATWSFTTADTAAPVVTATSPAASATGVALTGAVTATFAAQIDPATLAMSLSPAVAGTVAYDSASRRATFTPTSGLVSSTTYTASVRAKSTGGTDMSAAKTWTFKTTTADFSLFPTTATPATTQVSSTTAATVGVRFSSSRAGKVVSIRFWAASANTGKTVTLRNSSGTSLGTATTTSTAAGWRTATFSSPISITAGTTYVATYYAPAGRYAVTTGAFASAVTNGPLTVPASGGRTGSGNANPTTTTTNNMWVDVVVRI